MNSAVTLLLAAQVAGATLRPAEPGTPREALTPAVAEAAAQIVRLAVRESSEDTDFPTAVIAAIDDTSTHVRQNAYGSISVAVSSFRNSQNPVRLVGSHTWSRPCDPPFLQESAIRTAPFADTRSWP